LANNNSKVDTCCRDTTKNNGGYLRAIQWTGGQIKAESNTKDKLSHQEANIGCGEDLPKDTSSNEEKAREESSPSAKAISEPTAEEATEELSY
jgi:hypothetical protein